MRKWVEAFWAAHRAARVVQEGQRGATWATLAPSAITLIGSASLLCGVAVGSLTLILIGGACDIADGIVARAMGATTRYGAALDWVSDATCAHVIAWLLFPVPLAIVASLIMWAVQAAIVRRDPPWSISGRGAMVIAALISQAVIP